MAKTKTSMDPRLLETESIPKLLWTYALPAVITTLTTSIYNLIDRIFIGHGAGAMAISGLALSLPIMTFLQAFGTLVGVGASTRISIVLGMKDRDWAERILGNALFLTIIIWAFLTVGCLVFLEPLLKIFGGSENTIPYAADYLRIIIPGNIFANLSYSFCNIIRASGSPLRSMTIMISGMVVNAVLAPIFIFWFDWGIQGAAIATVIAMFVTAVQTMHFFLRKDAFIRFTRPNLKPAKKIIKNILSIGMSPFLMNIAASAVAIILNGRLATKGGDLAIGAYSIVNSYTILFVMFVIGLCQGMQPIVGYNYGARKMDRAKKTFFLSIKVGTLITSLGFVLVELFPRTAASVFTTDEQLIALTQEGLRFVFLLFPFVGFQIVTSNFFQSLGMVHLSIFLSLTRQVIFLIPALFICSALFDLKGVWMATPVADFLAIVVTFVILQRQMKKTSIKVSRRYPHPAVSRSRDCRVALPAEACTEWIPDLHEMIFKARSC